MMVMYFPIQKEKCLDNPTEILPLRMIAAKFISTNELEGLDELNRVTSDMYRIVRLKYKIWDAAFTALLAGTAVTILPGLWLTLAGVKGGKIIASLGLILFGFWVATICYWRWFQYGRTKANIPQVAIYANPNDPVARNLERFFQIAQLETTPRAFYLTRNNVRRYLKRRYFFGKLRAALLSEDDTVRALLFSPSGLWFSREVFMEVNVEALIEQAKAKPSRAGAPKTYDYTDAVMSLIEHPAIRNLVVGKRGNQTMIVGLLETWYDTKRVNPPSETQLTIYAKVILAVIEKNRASSS
jgi:hypothetical protein